MSKFAGPVMAVALSAVFLLVVGSVGASTPASHNVTVPSTATTSNYAWTGTIPPGVNPSSSCQFLDPVSDSHGINITVPAGTYDIVDAEFRFTISWADAGNDEILTVLDPNGDVVGSSDGGSNVETVVANNLAPGTYKVLACAFLSTVPVAYTGNLQVKTTLRAPETSLPSADAQGLAFSAAVASDNQRDQAEPLIEIDKAGNVYDCGPTGFSNASDYSQVSNDHGDQFHMLGTPPRGQQGAGGGGDCGLAFGRSKNSRGNYQYAYTGLGPLTGFVSSTSPNNGQSLASGGPFANGVTDEGGGADRQWMTFVDDHTVLLSYNQQQPRNVVVQRSTDGGLTYGVDAARAARSPRFPGPMRYIEPTPAYPNGIVYFAWDRTADDGDHVNLSISQDKGVTWTDCKAAVAPGTTTLFATADNDNAGNIYIAYGENLKFHTYLVSLTADKIGGCNQSVTASTALPTVDPGFSAPVQVDRDGVRTTLFAWLTAGGAPGRVAVTFVGTETDGNPNVGTFKASWDIYVNQSLNALDPTATFSQVKVTTHPFHYDSICINGLGCDLAVPPGDRSMADFISVDTNPVDGRIYVTWDRANKKPDEASGHVASPMVATQIAGPSLLGGTVTSRPQPVRTSSTDPPGDALSSYSTMTPAVVPPDPPTTNEPAGDLLSVSIGPEIDLHTGIPVPNNGITVTINVADLRQTALTDTMTRTGSQSLLWVLRFSNGYQDVAAAARWNPVQGFTFGYNEYTTGTALCESTGPSNGDKCMLYPGDMPLIGEVDQAKGTIRFNVPRSLLRGLSGGTGPGQRPTEVAATVGTRFYDATVFSLGNTVSPVQTVQSFLYPFDNTPSMDFLLPAAATGGETETGCRTSGGGTIQSGTNFNIDVHANLKGKVSARDANLDFGSLALTSITCPASNRAIVQGSGFDGSDGVTFTADVTDGGEKSSSDKFSLTLSNGKTRSGSLTQGNIQVKR